MTMNRPDDQPAAGTTEPPQHEGGAHKGHRWMMIACCVPMLALAVILVASGAAGAGFLFVAIGCTVVMALMMGGTGHGGEEDRRR